MTFSTRIIQGPVGRLAVTTAGKGGLPVLFVHGIGGNRAQWAALQAHLGQLTVSFDPRGLGESEPDPAGRYHFRDFAQDVGAVADGLGLGSFVLVGHGFGCVVAGEYAANHPGRVAGLVLAEPEESELDLRESSPEEHFSRYPGPCLALLAADMLARGPMTWLLQLPQPRVKILQGVSYGLMTDAPALFSAALADFLDEVEERVALEDLSPPGPTDATGAMTLA
jgi:pimeloyl-ACP methyl ester carboxylesterase